MPADAFGLVYAGLVAAGGLIGYLKAGSIPSLVAGVASGVVAGVASFYSNFYVLIGVGIVLSGLMGFRFLKSGKFMPAGLIAALSLLIIVRCVIYFIAKNK
ncbi:transmembrane protein 14C domain-containing protein [Ditylenchus destructor]|uniref:Transmembrane protein 14C domain-containing protein n=1 Tax=Ditylenchus destructor TaxID=166010 RepID=A0AAD4R6I9_9BILA|nr:transmembrane protein 14C domain-containing protein [Ditylenchus destructor]